jgi:peptidoglycan/LPS O-acetylase OafA/YrhL
VQSENFNLKIQTNRDGHVRILDSWRGLSILFVLAAHLLPLGPKFWQLNVSIGIAGMALFFILSGFLITSSLIKDQNISRFFIHRFCRIVPLVWLYLLIALGLSDVGINVWFSHFLFYANLPPVVLTPLTAHIWSLCVEVQFYAAAAIFVAILGVRGLLLLPILMLTFTVLRIWFGVAASSITYFRVDEILAGCALALVYHGQMLPKLREFIKIVPIIIVIPLFLISCMPEGQWLNFLRPYLAALLVGVSIMTDQIIFKKLLNHRFLIYCATTSYALYVIHPLLADSWLGSGDVYIKYLKRPLLFVVLFILAHLSTKYFERYFINIGKRMTTRKINVDDSHCN